VADAGHNHRQAQGEQRPSGISERYESTVCPVFERRAPHRASPPSGSKEERAYFEEKVDEGKTKKEVIRSLKRQISNTVYRHVRR
jgi:hypothetical protein